jgi:flavin-binding protein dodecin
MALGAPRVMDEPPLPNHPKGPHRVATYKKVEIVGTSTESVAEAIKAAIAEASKTIRNISWFEVAEIRGAVKGSKVTEFQVTVRIGFMVQH